MTASLRSHLVCALVLCFAALGCGNQTPHSSQLRVQGAGASFPAPLYMSWIKTFNQSHPNVELDYQSIGSGSGVKSMIDGTVDFAASDAAMTPEEMGRVARGVQLLPMTAGSIVLAFNLEGVSSLKLSRKAYAGIFSGTVKSWNDESIASTNPGIELPDRPINVIVRADSSGTSFVFTRHLSAISKEFAQNPGSNKMPNWAVGTRSKGNEGVTASIKTTPYSLGYVEYAYANSQKLDMAALENFTGSFVAPNSASGQAALVDTELPADMIAWNSDPHRADAYPIVTYTWLILYREYDDRRKLDALRAFIEFGLTRGQTTAASLGYIPLPSHTVSAVQAALNHVTLVAQR